jgi:hypothetical protein
MADGIGGLRSYISELTPQARALLLGEFERRVAAGQTEFESSVVLQELRALAPAKPLDPAAVLFFRPLEPFLVDDTSDRRHPGRLSRDALAPLWNWLGCDLIPDAVEGYAAQANEALEAGEVGTAEALARALQDRTAAALRSAFSAVEDDPEAQRQLLARLGTPRAGEDAEALRWIMRGRDMFAKLAAELPDRIDDLSPEQVEAAMMLIESTARPREIFPFSVITLMNRLSRPHQLVRLAAMAAGSRSASRMAETAYGVTITILVSELERLIDTLSRAVANSDRATAARLLKRIDATLQGMRAEIAIPVASSLGRELDSIGSEAAVLGRAALGSLQRMARSA